MTQARCTYRTSDEGKRRAVDMLWWGTYVCGGEKIRRNRSGETRGERANGDMDETIECASSVSRLDGKGGPMDVSYNVSATLIDYGPVILV